MNFTSFKKTFRTLLLIVAFGLLTGCASTSGPRATRYSANQYLRMAANTTGNTKQAYLLQAANQLINEKKANQARSVLKQTADNLPTNLRLKKQLVSAKLLIAYRQNDAALSTLQSMNPDQPSWTRKDKIEWYRIAAQANENLGNINTSIQQRSDIIALLPNDEKKPELLAIWNHLQNINSSRIHDLLSQATTPTVKGWLSLVAITDQSTILPQQLSNELQRWKLEYGNHPAVALLPANMRQLKNMPSHQPQHIALLLPLTGPYAKAGNAIRNGFFSAYYHAKQQGQPISEVTIINTADKNISQAYQEAVSKGANFVVGPLIKSDIAKLVKSTRLSVPTLALNMVPGVSNRNLYQFGLSPMDEARQAAIKAWDSHYYSTLVIAPKNNWGQSIVATFEKTWQSLGGQVVGKLAYTSQQNLSAEIRRLLNVDQATWNEVALKHVLRERLRYIPRRRKDTDMIFLVATPSMARQIRPLLRYFYAGNIPIYSISNVYTGQPNTHRDHDLNGIHFPDMPWVLSAIMKPDTLNSIRQHVRQIWPQSYASEPKLIALGVDAYDIIPKLNRMAMLPDLGTPAATGTLFLDRNQHIYRKLRWSKIRNGIPSYIQ